MPSPRPARIALIDPERKTRTVGHFYLKPVPVGWHLTVWVRRTGLRTSTEGIVLVKGSDAFQSAFEAYARSTWGDALRTLAARVHTLDGRPLGRSPLAGEVARMVDAAVLSDR